MPLISELNRPRLFIPSYLYRKGKIYYFRFALPKCPEYGGREIRLSLHTSYVREAKLLADALRLEAAACLSSEPMLSVIEIKKRLLNFLAVQIDNYSRSRVVSNDNPMDKAVDDADLMHISNDPLTDVELQKSIFNGYLKDKLSGQDSEFLTDKKRKWLLNLTYSQENFFAVSADIYSNTLLKFFNEEEISENQSLIGRLHLETAVIMSKYVHMYKNGMFVEAEKFISGYIESVNKLYENANINIDRDIQKPNQDIKPQSSKLFSWAIDYYIDEQIKSGAWKEHSVSGVRSKLSNFLDIIGDKPIEEIERTDMRTFRNILQKLPPNRTKSKKYKDKSIDEILKMKPAKTLNTSTINNIVEAVATMLDWYRKEGELKENPAKSLQIKDSRRPIELKKAFSKEDLEKIFIHPKFSQKKFKCQDYYWIPLIGLFSGMRLEEIAQLHCTDLRDVAGQDIWYFDITEQGENADQNVKAVKNKSAIRKVPVHKTLIDLGLLEYHDKIVKAGHVRLFPNLNQTDKTVKLGKQPGKQFKAVVNETLGKGAEKKSFHSLRHTFDDFYKRAGLLNEHFQIVFGHETGKLAVNLYGSEVPPDILYREIIAKLDYGLDFVRMLGKGGW
jgi:integrase